MEHRQKNVRRVALCAMLSGVSLVILLLACMVPSGRLGVTAVAGLCVGMASCVAGFSGGAGCYGASALLGLLLLPDKVIALCYTLLFGLYPLLKAAIEALHHLAAEWVIKLLAGNLLLVMLYCIFQGGFGTPIRLYELSIPVLWLLGDLVFICYDIAFSRIMTWVQVRLMPALRRSRLI